MTDTTTTSILNKIRDYFTPQDMGIIIILALLAFLTSSFGLQHILPGGGGSSFVHGFLKLPGPGAGIFISAAFTCLWLVLGLLIIKKPGTAITMAVLIFAFMLLVSLVVGRGIRLDYLIVVVAIIIEIFGILALEKKPWNYLFPILLVIMGCITLALMLTGNAKMGENGAAATVFPLGYAVSGILALCLAAVCFLYPTAKYIIGAGCSQVFYITFCWTFNGKTGLFSWTPVVPAIPALLTFAFVCGAVMAVLAYGFYLLWNTYSRHSVEKA
ncbi:hypothetical protein [Methanoregula sp. UBA64]|jgi:hypothetical protein|uniref:hypothetical protein n=1 Tax=Methanoregula sp. UBA64 TaxID=1915554 RepID=UPI0025F2D2EB|nr:hypothetical protein [Methanoregula sp. UBA64]